MEKSRKEADWFFHFNASQMRFSRIDVPADGLFLTVSEQCMLPRFITGSCCMRPTVRAVAQMLSVAAETSWLTCLSAARKQPAS